MEHKKHKHKKHKKHKNIHYDNQKLNKHTVHITLKDLHKFMKNIVFMFDTFGSMRKKLYENAVFEISQNRYLHYVPPSSNKQIQTIFNNTNIVFKNRFTEMITHFVGELYTDIIITMIKHKCNDNEIYEMIKYGKKNNNLSFTKNYSKEWRINRISDKIEHYTNLIHNDKSHVPNILDVGVGNGKNAYLLNKMTKCNIYGADIDEWGPYLTNKKFNFPFVTIQTNPYRIPFDDIKFDFIMLILTLHHCENIFDTINECKRLLTDKGMIIIIEHDTWNDYDHMIIDVQHNIYTKIYDEPYVSSGSYFNYFEWDYLFSKCGMVPDYGDLIEDSPSFHVRYDIQFIGIYKKAE